MQVDAWRQKLSKSVHFDNFWWLFHYFAIESRKLVHFGHLKKLALSDENWLFCVAMGATRCLKAETAKNVFILKILLFFLLFCDRVIKVSSFWPPTKICTFQQHLNIFGWEWMKLDASRLELTKMCSLWRTLVLFSLFRDRVIKASSFCPTKKFNFFRQTSSFFG